MLVFFSMFCKNAGWHMQNLFHDPLMDSKTLPCEVIFRYTHTHIHTFLHILGQYVKYMSHHSRQKFDAILSRCWFLFPSSCLETFGIPLQSGPQAHLQPEGRSPFYRNCRISAYIVDGEVCLARRHPKHQQIFPFLEKYSRVSRGKRWVL